MSALRYPDVELDGPARADALRRCRAKIAEWGVVVPEDFILVLNFGLDEFEQTGLTEFWVANETGAGYCGKGQPAKVDAGGPYIRCRALLGGEQ